MTTYPDSEKPPDNPWRCLLWRIRHDGLKETSNHYLLIFARWYVGAVLLTVTYPDGAKFEFKKLEK